MSEIVLKGKLIGQGNTAEIFEWDNNNILKLYRNGLSEDLCTKEFELTKYAFEHLNIAPKPIKLIYSNGRAGAIYERLTGKTMLKLLLSKPWNFRKYSKLLAHSHIKIHQRATLSAVTVKEKLREDIENVTLLSLEEKQLLYKYIDTLPDGDCICHFDFHPDNIILLDKKYYVIDWMTACIGDPLSDVARTLLLLKFAEIPRVPGFVNLLVKLYKKIIYHIYLTEYLEGTGATLSDIERWELPLAAARLCEWIPEREFKKLLNMVKMKLSKI